MERSLAQIALFAALIAVLGLVPAMVLPIGVPITAQSLGIMLCGTVLGARRGALAVLLFVALTLAGLPLLSGGRGGIGLLAGPSAGFIIGFPIAAFVCGLVMERLRMGVLGSAVVAALVGGIVVLYLIGVPVLWVRVSEEGLSKMFSGAPGLLGLPLPLALAALFLPGDLIKVALCALATRAIARARPEALLSRRA